MGMLRDRFGATYRMAQNDNREDTIPMKGSRGEIYEIGPDGGIGVYYSDCKPSIMARNFLKACPEATVSQEGDFELVMAVPWEYAEKGLKAAKAIRKRSVSPEERARLAKMGFKGSES
jgi:hypothetical protein